MASAAVTQTRLDRLVTLLESGSSPAIRATAARQLGQIAAVRVRGDSSSSSAAVKEQAQHAASSSKIVVKEEQLDDGFDGKDTSRMATPAVVEGSGSSRYRGVDGEWEQAVFLIARVLPHLRSKVWDTRMAAAQAIDAICAASGTWDPDSEDSSADGNGPNAPELLIEQDQLTFESFSLPQIFSHGKKLLSSSGNEYDLPASMSVEERLAHAKRDMQRLGLGSMAGVDMDIGVDMEQELLIGNGEETKAGAVSNSPNQDSSNATPPTVEVSEVIDMSKLSARERNQLKRKRKMESKSGGGGGGGSSASGETANKIRVVDGDAGRRPSVTTTTATDKTALKVASNGAHRPSSSPHPSIDATASPGPQSTVGASEAASLVPPAGHWPFAMVCALLLSDLFSPKWEIRHGAALGLRELLKSQGLSGGKVTGGGDKTLKHGEGGQTGPNSPNADHHERWSGDIALRLLCVLTLDRLGDFVFDQVIAPVRETAAQALASLLKWMSAPTVAKVHAVLRQMITQDFLLEKIIDNGDIKGNVDGDDLITLRAKRGVAGYAWEVRHAGLLGLRNEVTVRDDLLEQDDVLRDITRLSIACLRDGDDDVRSVAAKTLHPVIEKIIVKLPGLVPLLLEQLWDGLSSLKDDLSSSTAGVMDLLARLAERTDMIRKHLIQGDSVLASAPITRLLPFFRHTISSVRLSVLNALLHFLAVPSLPTDWVDERVIRLTYQNLIVEERPAIREASMAVWNKVMAIVVERDAIHSLLAPNVQRFFALLMTPLGTPIDYSLFYRASNVIVSRERHDVDKGILSQDLALVGVDTVIRGRLGAAEALGSVIAQWPDESRKPTFDEILQSYLQATSALQRCLAGVVIQEWAQYKTVKHEGNDALASSLGPRLLAILDNPSPSTYGEMSVMLQRIKRQCQRLLSTFAREGKLAKSRIPSLPDEIDTTGTLSDAFTLARAEACVDTEFDSLLGLVSSKNKDTVRPLVEDLRGKIIAEIGFYQSIKERQDRQVSACAAAATIALRNLPAKLNPVIRSVMNSVKFEENADLQRRSARATAYLIDQLCARDSGLANPSDKIVKNLCAFVCQDITQTPIFEKCKQVLDGILSLHDEQIAQTPAGNETITSIMTEEEREGRNIRRGAEIALEEICRRFGPRLFDLLPSFLASISGSVTLTFSGDTESQNLEDDAGQAVIDCCTLSQAIVRHLHPTLQVKVEDVLRSLCQAVKSKYAVIRSAASKTLASLAESLTTQSAMLHIVRDVLPLLGDATNVTFRQGAIETVSFLVRLMDVALLPYVVVLIVPVLGRMSDPDESVRLVATHTFAALVKMVPLEAGLPDPPGLDAELLTRRQDERAFLAQLLDGKKLDKYVMPVPIKAELRPYQVDGVSWMAFLAKFQLHGALCDDMGVGKTLQSICILSSKHFERSERFKQTGSNEFAHLPSLVVCPPTLTGHWSHEIRQYATNLRPLLYTGHPTERARLLSKISEYDCVVASYDTVRNDVDALSKFDWLYCILDEGHVIKSAKTKTTKAVKMIKAQHRLILSGTPIQNNVLELWSLFDFLMPGFLGTEKQFMERYGRPILASRDAKVSAREHERAALALDALHKQVLPFVLRRMKEDVLDDLPPKIIQDISCEMSDVQRQLFDDYMRTQNRDELNDDALQDGTPDQQQHVFQTLQYLRRLVCHPLMVFDPQKPRHRQIEQALKQSSGKTIADIANAPKLLALKQLLLDCGIGTQGAAGDVADAGISQHRVLIFCQQRRMLDIIERDLFRGNMPDVTFARLDGSITAPEKRYEIVQRFNADPSIDVLLLTTSVGGLGLTLTGADTVIFVEHDWNPMKDMQAMDRAHRLGQKKVVNVYRLITKDTLEEQIMGLQRFKLNVAGNIVNQQNKDTDSMQTDQILDLFDVGAGVNENGEQKVDPTKKSKGISQKALLASIEGMGDTGDDYEGMAQWSATDG